MDLDEQVLRGALSRRKFLHVAGAGAAMVALPGLLAACGGDEEEVGETDTGVAGEGQATTAAGGEAQATEIAGGAEATTETETTSAGNTTTAGQDDDPTEAQQGGTLTIGRPSDAVGLDPKVETTSPGNWVMSNIYETLVVFDQQSEFLPGLAEKWEQVDESTWRFSLREGVVFHDGTEFTADAVKFSIDRQKDPENPGRSASNLSPIIDVKVVDPYTVDVITEGPYGPLLNIMSLIYAAGIVSPSAVEEFGEDFVRNPVGTGPFKFVEWASNDHITIERFEEYWGDPALLDQAVYRVIPEESARMLALETGEIDMVMQPAPSQIELLKEDDNFNVIQTEGVRVVFFGFNTARPIVSDPTVRKAINHGVNREEIVANVLEGAASLPTSYISPAIFGYKDVSDAWEYNPELANQMLEEAGWVDSDGDGIREKDGQPLEIKHLSPRGRYLKDAEISEAFQAAMLEIGVQVNLELLEWAALFEQLRQPNIDADLFTLGWSTATGDADYTLGPMFVSSNIPPVGWNSFQYSNPEIDELAELARKSTDPEERERLYGEMLDILVEDAVWVPIYNTIETVVSGSYVKGFEIHPIDYYLWLHNVWLDR